MNGKKGAKKATTKQTNKTYINYSSFDLMVTREAEKPHGGSLSWEWHQQEIAASVTLLLYFLVRKRLIAKLGLKDEVGFFFKALFRSPRLTLSRTDLGRPQWDNLTYICLAKASQCCLHFLLLHNLRFRPTLLVYLDDTLET